MDPPARPANFRPVILDEQTSDGVGTEAKPRGAWIRYSVEYRNLLNRAIVYKKSHTQEEFISHVQGDHRWASDRRPALELIAQYEIIPPQDTGRPRPGPPPPPPGTIRPPGLAPLPAARIPGFPGTGPGESLKDAPLTASAPTRYLHIYSISIVNALRSVVQYYPGQDLAGDSIVVRWPYPILVHHYDELVRFRDSCTAKAPDDLCVREKDAYEHIVLLLKFLDDEVMQDVKAEQDRNKRGYYTFAWSWVRLRPGVCIMDTMREREEGHWNTGIIHSLQGGVFVNPPTRWEITKWSMSYDGSYLGRECETIEEEEFDGEKEEEDNDIRIDFGDEQVLEEHAVVKRQVELGKKFWQLLKKQCLHHKGKAVQFPHNTVSSVALLCAVYLPYSITQSERTVAHVTDIGVQINGLVMSDLKTFYASATSPPDLMDDRDLRNWVSDCSCASCTRSISTAHNREKKASRFHDYNYITIEAWDELTPHQYLLCPTTLKVFVFRTRSWGKSSPNHDFRFDMNRE